MKRAKNVSVAGLTLLLAVCMIVGLTLSLGGRAAAQAETEQTISLDGVQMRGHTNGYYYYLVLLSPSYSGLATPQEEAGIPNGKDLIDGKKIKLYLSAEDQGTALSDLTIQHVEQNLWGTNGILINYAEYDSTHGGHQVYKVVVEKGCRIPYLAADGSTVGTYIVDKDYTFYNGSYGDETAKLGAMSWTGKTVETISLEGVQLRGLAEYPDNSWYHYFVMKSSAFADMTTDEGSVESGSFESTLDKISLYTVTDGNLSEAKLSELGVNHTERNKWSEQGLFFAFDKYKSGYDGSAVYKVTVRQGCEIVANKSGNITTVFAVDKDYTFYNGSYGNADNKFAALSWTSEPTVAYGTTEQTITLDGLQLRGMEGNAWYQYLVLLSSAYNDLGELETVVSGKSFCDLSGIKLYTVSDGELTEKNFDQLTTQYVGRNKWGEKGAFLQFNEYANGYGGSDVYKVTVAAGTKIVAEIGEKATVFAVDKDYTFYNGSYGNADNKFGAYNWTSEPTIAYRTREVVEEISVGAWGNDETGRVQFRSTTDGAEKYFVILSDSYSGLSAELNLETSNFRTTLDKIKLYTLGADGELTESKMSEQNVTAVGRGYWGTPGAFISFGNIANFAGHKTYKVVLDEGLEILAKDEIVGEERVKTVYKTTQAYTFYNKNWDSTNDDVTFNANNWSETPAIAYKSNEQTITLDGLQLRGVDSDARYQYLVLLSSAYNDLGELETVVSGKSFCDLSGIKLYTVSDGELTEKNFDQLTTQYVGRNMWGAKGAFLQFNEYANGYGGSDVYKVIVAAGTKVVAESGEEATVFVVDKDYTFYNGSYGNEANKFGAMTWTANPTIAYKTTEQTISLEGIQLRGLAEYPDNSWYHYIVFQSESFGTNLNEMLNSGLSASDLSKVMLYLVGADGELTGKALTELGVNHIETNKWSQSGGFVAFDGFKNGYDGSKVYKVTVAAGTKIALSADEEAIVLVIDKDYTFYNMSYGNEDNKFAAYDWVTNEPVEEIVSLSGVQIRAMDENNAWYQYLVLQSNAIGGSKVESAIKSGIRFDKIKLYTSKDDKDGVSLQTLGVNHVDGNMWSTNGAFVNYGNYATYNGTTVYKVLVEAGCKIPVYSVGTDGSVTVKIYVVDKDYEFYNVNYGSEDKKLGAFEWWNTPVPETVSNSGEINVVGVSNQSDGVSRWLILWFNEKFVGTTNVSFYEKKGFTNVLDNIYLYSGNDLSQTPIKLRDIFTGTITVGQFGSPDAIGFTIANDERFNGTNNYLVVIKQGCEMPFIKDGVYSKRTVTADTSFVNNDYGKTGEIPGSTGSDSRLYENFTIDWSKAVFVTYKAVGIDDVTFDTQCLVAGTQIDTAKFAKEGYDVSVTDNLGYTYYGTIYLPSADVEITLTYTKQQTEPTNDEVGCNGVVAASGAVAVLAVTIAAAVVCKRKRK